MLKTKIFFLIGVLFFSFGLSFGLTNFEGRESFKANLQKKELQEIPQSSWENFLDYGNSYDIYYETEGKDVIDWSFLGDPIFVGITVMAMDFDEYWNYLNDWSYSSYLLSNGSTHVDSGSFIVPYSDTWYIVFLNNDTDTTTTYLVFNAVSTYNDFGGTLTDYGEWYYRNYSGGILESGTVDWAFEGSNTEVGITAMAMDDYNYGQFVGGYSYTPYFLTPGANYTDSGTFTVPYDDVWYFVFLNNDTDQISTDIVSSTYYISPWGIIHNKIFIDGDDGATDWDKFPNKTGSGTFADPYIIENLYIDAGGTESGIFIQDSGVYAEIIDCNTSNSGNSYGDAGIRLLNCSNIKIINCTSEYNGYFGIFLYGSNNNTLSGNNASYNTEDGIYLSSSSDNILSGNNASYNDWHGIYLSSSSNNTLSGNNASYNDWYGIYLFSSSNTNTLSENTASYNAHIGILLEYSSDNIVSGNNASYNTRLGIQMNGLSNSTLSWNTLCFNGDFGIYLISSSNNTFFKNNASYNTQLGIRLDNSPNNTIYFNIFQENSDGAAFCDNSLDNAWDNGTLGNYWGDYQEKYPAATNNLTLWDTPYQIDADNIDYFPLVNMDGSEVANTNPTISHPIDIDFTIGSTGNNLDWTISDLTLQNSSYIIYKNGNPIEMDSWIPGSPIIVDLDALLSGKYNFTIVAVDGLGGNVSDSVWVTVWNEMGLITHAPFIIDGNTALANFPNKTGLGTFLDPYIIENLLIDVNNSGSGIHLQNIDLFLQLINCTIIKGGINFGDAGIRLENCINIKIIQCSLNNHGYFGIYLNSSSNNTLSGNDVNYNTYNGIYLFSSTNNTLSGNNASYNTEYGIFLSSGSTDNLLSDNIANHNQFGIVLSSNSHRSTLSGNTVCYNSVHGIQLSNTMDIILSGNNASYNTGYGIFLPWGIVSNVLSENIANHNAIGIVLTNNSDHDSYNNTLSGNIVNYNTQNGIYLCNSSDNTLSGNTASYNTDDGIYLYFSSNNTLSGNTVNGNSYGIYLYFSSNNTLSGNTANDNSYGIQLTYSSNNTLSGNIVMYNSAFGISLYFSSNSTLSGNIMINSGITISNSIQNTIDPTNLVNNKPIYYFENQDGLVLNGAGLDVGQLIFINCTNSAVSNFRLFNCSVGIHLENSDFNTFENISVLNTNGGGILVLNSHNNTFSSNKIENCAYGIYLANSEINYFSQNSIINSSSYGIVVSNGTNNDFIANTISNSNDCGIYVYSGSDNNFWLNILIGNINNQALDNGEGNNWDNGTHGNFWGDFQSRYPFATAIGRIWDTSYEIEGDSGTSDNFPLVFSPVPDAPTWITLDQTITVKNITVQWNAIQGVEYYHIYVDGVFNITTEETSYIIFLLTNGTYEITVRAISWYCESHPSSSLFITVAIPSFVPLAPEFITGSQTIPYTNLTVSWNPVSGATSYNIHVNGTLNETTSSTSQQIWLHVNGTYIITVTAVNTSGQSNHSVAITIIVEIPPVDAGNDTTDDPSDDRDPWYTIPWVWSAIGAGATVLFGVFSIMKKTKKTPGYIIKNMVNRFRK